MLWIKRSGSFIILYAKVTNGFTGVSVKRFTNPDTWLRPRIWDPGIFLLGSGT
ncbi:hypothetical protein Csa_023504, partial [Cucumis sativus]